MRVTVDLKVASGVHEIYNVVNVHVTPMASIVSREDVSSHSSDCTDEVFTVLAVNGTATDGHVALEFVAF